MGTEERGSPPSPLSGLQKPNHPGRSVDMVMKILAQGFGVFVLTLLLMVVFSMFLHGI